MQESDILPPTQARNQFGTPSGVKNFLRGAKIFLNFVQ